jgi:hypothetical protein
MFGTGYYWWKMGWLLRVEKPPLKIKRILGEDVG